MQCSCYFDLEINYPKFNWQERVNYCACIPHGGEIFLRSNGPLYSTQGGPQVESQKARVIQTYIQSHAYSLSLCQIHSASFS